MIVVHGSKAHVLLLQTFQRVAKPTPIRKKLSNPPAGLGLNPAKLLLVAIARATDPDAVRS